MKVNYSIQGLRGFCALVVFLCHLVGMAGVARFLHFNEFWTKKNEVIAASAVNLFFIISGYLIIHSLVKHCKIKKFIKNRILRIYPVYLVLFVIMFAVGPVINFEWFAGVHSSEYIKNLFGNLFMLQGIFPIPQAVQNSWSLGYEFAFYAIASLTFIFSTTDVIKNRYVKLVCLAIPLIISLAIVFFHPRALFFLIGVFLYFMEKSNKLGIQANRGNYSKWFFNIKSLIFLLLTIISFEYNIFISLVFSFLFFMDMVREKGIVSRVLQSRLFQYLGTISYSLYLWHPFGIFPFKIILPKVIPTDNNAILFMVFAVFGTILTFVLSHLSYTFIEKWLTNKIKERNSSRIYREQPTKADQAI